MKLRVTCWKCEKTYQVASEFAGKKFRCKRCGETLQIPRPQAKHSETKSPQSKRPQAKRPKAKQRLQTQDPEFDYGDFDYEDNDFEDYGEEFAARLPARRKDAAKSRGRKRRSGRKRSSSTFPVKWPLIIGGGFFTLLAFGGFFIPVFWGLLGFAVGLTGFALALWGSLKLLVTAFQEDVSCGLLYLFVPFYAPYYIISRWSETARPFLANLGGVGLLLLIVLIAKGGVSFLSMRASDPTPEEIVEMTLEETVAETVESPETLFTLPEPPDRFPSLDDEHFSITREKDAVIYNLSAMEMNLDRPFGPGARMQLLLYLPPGDHSRHSLPCVLVPPAGTNLLTGNVIDYGADPAEHYPYVKSGMAVVTFSLDGWLGKAVQGDSEGMAQKYQKFHAAAAGLINARNALEFLIASVSEVNPKQIYIAGHSSAGTLALLFAEHEPRLAGCLAYAPETDVEASVGDAIKGVSEKHFPGIKAFVKKSSPKTHLAKLKCPVFLFHARGDTVTPYSRTESFAKQLKKSGKDVTLVSGTGSDHYQTMISQGIPEGIKWLKYRMTHSSPTAAPSPTIAGNLLQKNSASGGNSQATPSVSTSANLKTLRYKIGKNMGAVKSPYSINDLEKGLMSVQGYIPDSAKYDSKTRIVSVQFDGADDQIAWIGHAVIFKGGGFFTVIAFDKFADTPNNTRTYHNRKVTYKILQYQGSMDSQQKAAESALAGIDWIIPGSVRVDETKKEITFLVDGEATFRLAQAFILQAGFNSTGPYVSRDSK